MHVSDSELNHQRYRELKRLADEMNSKAGKVNEADPNFRAQNNLRSAPDFKNTFRKNGRTEENVADSLQKVRNNSENNCQSYVESRLVMPYSVYKALKDGGDDVNARSPLISI
ncbi:MAG: hypothetical protein CBB87_04225 [Micavibrio sp. TMED27]|nr:hypothetical protein [Micavibrio sp.]OUT91242.1 MAG: hypothetical protein CBB87_04225 [Micavibrio sp. TMED27]|tara:strand:+ start:1008 stop:1346 length:339 start_codon:yes stop_codon:yes gene_type:complete